MTSRDTIDYARVEVLIEEADQISRVNARELEPHIKPPTNHVHGEMGLEGVVEGKPMSIQLDSRSGVSAISEKNEGVSEEGIRTCAGDRILQRDCQG